MKTTTSKFLYTAVAVSFLGAMACGDDHAKVDGGGHPIDSPTHIDAPADSPGSGSGSAKVFHQVEELARPGINEALLISNDFLNGYNAAAPQFSPTVVDPTTLAAVVGEAKTVLKALYLGTCLIDGVAGLTPQTGFKPGGQTCAAVGAGVFQADGVTLTAAAGSGAAAYADLMFSQFIPDVMRIDTNVAVSGYANEICGGSGGELLCGGRFIDDDVIDITYGYLIGGLDARVPLGSAADSGDATSQQLAALVSDGVQYYSNTALNKYSATASDPSNTNQFHPAPSQAFPYSAAPF